MTDGEEKQATCFSCKKLAGEARRCEVCGESFCDNCIVDVAGNHVCAACKQIALSQLRNGEPVGPLQNKKKIKLPIHSERNIASRENVKKFYLKKVIPIVLCLLMGIFLFPLIFRLGAVAVPLIAVFLPVWFVVLVYLIMGSSLRFPEEIYVYEDFISYKLNMKKSDFEWKKVDTVNFSYDAFRNPKLITILSGKKKIHVDYHFEKFEDIAIFVWNKCKEEGIPITEK